MHAPQDSSPTYATNGKTIVLRKSGHWYVFNTDGEDEKSILLTLLEYAENESFAISHDEVMTLIDQLGWEVEIHDKPEDLKAAG